jgi:hypothetical protein
MDVHKRRSKTRATQSTMSRATRVARAGLVATALAASWIVFPGVVAFAKSGGSQVPGPLHSQRGTPNLLRDVLKDPERFWPTAYGPSYANVLTGATNFLPCKGGPFALCYYSGPEPLGCRLSADGRTANCECLDVAYGVYFVDINAILKHSVYQQAVRVCGADGSACAGQINKAPVCDYINRNMFLPGADRISAFSFNRF